MTQKENNLLSAYHQANEMLYDIQILTGDIKEVKINTRSKTTWGWCKRRDGGFVIEIADCLLEHGNEKELLNTMLHELLHTVSGTHMHNQYWQDLAEKVNEKYGTNVQTTNDYENINFGRKTNFKHVIQCTKCGETWFYTKYSRAVRYPEKCRCPICKTKTIKRVTEQYKQS